MGIAINEARTLALELVHAFLAALDPAEHRAHQRVRLKAPVKGEELHRLRPGPHLQPVLDQGRLALLGEERPAHLSHRQPHQFLVIERAIQLAAVAQSQDDLTRDGFQDVRIRWPKPDCELAEAIAHVHRPSVVRLALPLRGTGLAGQCQ